MVFAVVDYGQEQGRLACFLRYQKTPHGFKKLSTEQANEILKHSYPDYVFYSEVRDTWFHGVRLENVVKHYQPRQRLQDLFSQRRTEGDLVIKDLIELCSCFKKHGCDLSNVGVTGSILIDAQQETSDIDLVIYQRKSFIKWQQLVSEGLLQTLDPAHWQDAYQRRGCTIDFDQYFWHEQRKNNKGMVNSRKFDLSLVQPSSSLVLQHYQKRGAISLVTKVIEDTYIFDYPAVYVLDHPDIRHAVSYTATYSGQAKKGETVKIVGQLEAAQFGNKRVVVGSDREAKGECILVTQQEN